MGVFMKNLQFITTPKAEFPIDRYADVAQLRTEYYKEEFKLPPPSIDYYIKHLGVKIPTHRYAFWTLALNEEGEIVGYGNIAGNSSGDNLNTADFEFYVRKMQNREKYEELILEELASKVNPKVDVFRIFLSKDSLKANYFEKRYRIKPKITSVMSVSDLSLFDQNKIREIVNVQKQKASKSGYSFILVEDFDFSPRIDIAEYVKIIEELINDVPQEDLATERMVYSEERLEQDYNYWINEGMKCLTYVAVKENTTIPAGFTHTNLSEFQPQVATQYLTGVIRSHRGKGLGLGLKYHMLLKLLEESDANFWLTSNARINTPMRNINEILGYKHLVTRCGYEVKRTKLEE
jgi:hypothetical protein